MCSSDLALRNMALDAGLVAQAEAIKAHGLRPLNPTTAPVAECREMQARIAAVVGEGSVPLAREQEVSIAGPRGPVPCRLYLPDGVVTPPLMVYAHGGSFALGSLNAWDGLMRDLARASGVAMLSVDYRLAPEHRFPAGFEDMLAVVKHVAHEGAALGIDAQRLAVGGDSAGGNLALATAVALRDSGASPLKFMLLVYGVYSTDSTTPSWQTLGAPGASFRQSTARIPGTSMPMTLIEFKNIERKELSGRTQDPGTTVLQLIVKDVAALSAKLKAAGVPFVTTGAAPVQVAPGLKIVIVKDPNNLLLELAERGPR